MEFSNGTERSRWQAVLDNDAGQDGVFFYGVASTGIFCRPSCPSRPPRRDNVRFFETREEAIQAGFRPCKRCRPDLLAYAPERETARRLKALLDRRCADPAALNRELADLGLSRRRLEEIFLKTEGRTITEYLNRLRVERAKALLQTLPVSQAAYEAGFGSLSAFYRHFRAAAGCSPAQFQKRRNGYDHAVEI